MTVIIILQQFQTSVSGIVSVQALGRVLAVLLM